jgi:hypothetical protein
VGPDGTIIFATNNPTTSLQRVSAAGGDPMVLTKPVPRMGSATTCGRSSCPEARRFSSRSCRAGVPVRTSARTGYRWRAAIFCVATKHVTVGEYSRSASLVIDPAIVYSTYLGGAAYEFVCHVARDRDGAVYQFGVGFAVTGPRRRRVIWVQRCATGGRRRHHTERAAYR